MDNYIIIIKSEILTSLTENKSSKKIKSKNSKKYKQKMKMKKMNKL